MTKSFKELMEEINNVVPTGMKPVGIQAGMDVYTLDHLDKFAAQISAAGQPEMSMLLPKIEQELAKFGYTLGQLDTDDISDSESDGDLEDLIVFEKASKKMVPNMYISLDWERLDSPATDVTMQRKEILTLAVTMTIERTTPEELKAMLGDVDNADAETMDDADADDAPTETGMGMEVTGQK